MPLTAKQLNALIGVIASTTSDSMDCDGCFDLIAEYAEVHLAGKPIPEALAAVEAHLLNCPCCEHELQALLEALRTLDESESSIV